MSALLTIEAEDTNQLLDQLRALAGPPAATESQNTLTLPATVLGLAVYSDDELTAELQARVSARGQTVVIRAARGTKAAPKRDLVDSYDPDQADQATEQATEQVTDTADTADTAETDKDKYDRAIRELAALFGQGGLARGLVLAAQKTLNVAKFVDIPAERADELLTVVANIQAEVDAAATADSPL